MVEASDMAATDHKCQQSTNRFMFYSWFPLCWLFGWI